MSRPLAVEGPDPERVERPWIGAYPPGVPPSYRYPPVVLPRFLDDAVRDFPDVTAIDAPGGITLSYPDVADAVDRLAAALESLGIGHRVPVGLLLPAGPTSVVTHFATWRLGGVVVSIGTGREDHEVHRRLAAAGCRVLVTDLAGSERLRSIRGALPLLHQTVVTTPDDWQPRLRRVVTRLRRDRGARRRAARDESLWLDDVLDTPPSHMPQKHVEPDDVAAVGFADDGAALAITHGQLVAAAFQSRLWVPDVQAGRERVAVALADDDPQALVAGVLDPVLSAATIVITPRSPQEAGPRIADARPTLLRAPAGLFHDLLERSDDLTSLRACLATTGPLDGDDVAMFADVTRGARLRRCYGPSSALGLTHANPVYGRAAPDAIGLPVSDTSACVVDPADLTSLRAPGEPGRLLVHGPQVAIRPWHAPTARPAEGAEEQDPPTPGRWLDTGATASRDADGWFSLLDPAADGAHEEDPDASRGGILNDGSAPADASGEDQP